MLQEIPLAAVPSQTLSIVLSGQNCQISVYQKSPGLYMDLAIDGVPVLATRPCRNTTPLVVQHYSAFVGDLAFVDTQGHDDPYYAGLGTRWRLGYLSP